MSKLPRCLSEYKHLSLPERYVFAKHVINLVRLSSGFWANPLTVTAFSKLLLPFNVKTLLVQAHEDAKQIITWEDYKCILPGDTCTLSTS